MKFPSPFIILALTTAASAAEAPARSFRVVIDPGHGGSDLGTVYEDGQLRVAEKDVTLRIAQEAARQLRLKGILTTLTRTRDQEVPLPNRTAMANRLSADVFISIHMNSTPEGVVVDAEGIETYILNNATDASSRRLAKLENSVLGGSQVIQAGLDKPEGMDVALILKDLRLDANLSESKRLACAVQSQLVTETRQKRLKLRDRGVKQALFHVLLGADMPSILLEAGFLTHPRDRAVVLSAQGRRSIALAVARAVEQFRDAKNTRAAHSMLSRCKVN